MYKSLKDKKIKKIKNHADMFRILCDPSSGRTELCLTEITVMCVYGTAARPDRTHITQVQNYAVKHRPSTRQNICESLRVISVKHSSTT
jgi:hypothetical protein